MTVRTLGETNIQKAWRIGDPAGRWPIWSAAGSAKYPGRWNTRAAPLIYTCQHYSTAMLEKLVHGSGHLPPNQHFIEIALPATATYEVFAPHQCPGWDLPSPGPSQAYGERWVQEARTLVLLVPSVLAPAEYNILVNPAHPDFHTIPRPSPEQPVFWDARLFGWAAPKKAKKRKKRK